MQTSLENREHRARARFPIFVSPGYVSQDCTYIKYVSDSHERTQKRHIVVWGPEAEAWTKDRDARAVSRNQPGEERGNDRFKFYSVYKDE